MKRKFVVIVGALLLACTLLPGCANESSVSDAETAVANDKYDPEYESSLEGIGVSFLGDETRVHIGDENYCAGAVHLSTDWMPEDITASYIDETAPWAEGGDFNNYLWSPDYGHKFEISYHHNN